jgi:FeS assembly SUF system regulator
MLRISKLTDYATVILSYLALEPNQAMSAAQIAKAVHLSLPTASKILKILGESQMVTSFRGANGGYQLARPAAEITIAEVVAAIEGNPAITECCSETSLCALDSLCAIKDNWKIVNNVIMRALADLTLADMMRPMKGQTWKGIPIKINS